MIAGVAGGMAERWNTDPSLLRLLWVLATIFTGGLAFVVYIILAVVVPEDPLGYGPPPSIGTVPRGGAPGAPNAATELRAQRAAEYADERDARRAARAERAAERGNGGRNVALIAGTILILIGVWFLVRRYVPWLDTDRSEERRVGEGCMYRVRE